MGMLVILRRTQWMLTRYRSCYYPVPDAKFDLETYLGTWYQVAGTPFGPTAGARCVTANYALNAGLARHAVCMTFC